MNHSKIALIKKVLILLSASLIMLFPAVSASGAETVLKGTLTIKIAVGETAVSGADITLYKVADADIQGESFSYTFTDAFRNCGVDIDKTDGDPSTDEIMKYIKAENISGTKLTTGSQGNVEFGSLDAGLYLAAQTNDVKGFSRTEPFFAFVPDMHDGEIRYNVDASPKVQTELLSDIAVKKVWNDGGEKRPEKIEVQLRKGSEIYASATLSQENKWSYTWKELPKSDEWNVEEVNVPQGYKASYKQDGDLFIIENTASAPQTGQLKWPVPVFAGCGVVLVTFGFALKKKKHE